MSAHFKKVYISLFSLIVPDNALCEIKREFCICYNYFPVTSIFNYKRRFKN